MYKREFSAQLIIASKGTEEAEVRATAYGEIRSRDGANLKYTSNDAKGIVQRWGGFPNLPKEAYVYLEEPTKWDVENALHEINQVLSNYPQEQTGVDLFFAGHGQPSSGSLVLKDDVLCAQELITFIAKPLEKTKGSRGLSLILDSCYAGSLLIDIILELHKEEIHVSLFDALVSSMHDEKSWELSFLEHGAFTFSFLNRGNAYVNNFEFARAVERNDNKVIAKCLQGMVGSIGASSVAFLTQGRQHSIDCINGHHISIDGHGSFSLGDIQRPITKEVLIDRFLKAKDEIWENKLRY